MAIASELQKRWQRLTRRIRRKVAINRPYSFRELFLTKGHFGNRAIARKHVRAKRVVHGCMVGLSILLVLAVGLTFGSMAWVVTDLRVEGAVGYDGDELLTISGIRIGDRMLGFDTSAVEAQLQTKCPLLATVEVERAMDGTVSISVTEEKRFLWTSHYQNEYLLSADTLRVIAVDSSSDTWKSMNAQYIGLPEEAWLQVGETLTYRYLSYPAEGEAADAEVTTPSGQTAMEYFRYVGTVRDAILGSSLGTRVTGMELGDRYDLWFLLDGRIKVCLGDADSLTYKLSQAELVLSRQQSTDIKAVLDVSDPAQVSYREVPDMELPAWA